MKYEKIIYIYPFPIGSFLNPKVGLEATLEEGDDYLECFDKIRQDVKEMARIEQDAVRAAEQGYSGLPFTPIEKVYEKPQTIHYTKPPAEERRIGLMASDILSCGDIKTLETYKLLVKSKPELESAYIERYNQLKNGMA
jgi:hypothetical protein